MSWSRLRALGALGSVCALAGALLSSACATRGHRSPEALREAYGDALGRDDPDAAYDLLAPAVQATISREAFRARWAGDPAAREAAAADLGALPSDLQPALGRATTVHPDGAVLEWSATDTGYWVTAGLPGIPDRSTPAQAIRALLAGIRAADLGALEGLLADELRARLADDWDTRADAIEERLREPGAIELSADDQQALLRYAPGRAIALQQGEGGWQITSID